MHRTPLATAANVEDANAEFDASTPRTQSATSVTPMKSQWGYSSILAMGKYMGRLLAVFGDVEQEECKYTNLWRHVDYNVLTATEESEQYIDKDISTDVILCHKAT